MPLHPFYFLLALSLASAFTCADYPLPPSAHSLDYLEFHHPKGWILRIDGDGSGRLRCSEYPGRMVRYLTATFELNQLPRHFQQCSSNSQISSSACLRAVYYEASSNKTSVCNCPDQEWVNAYFTHAFSEIPHSPGEVRDRRLIKRHWLNQPPVASEELRGWAIY
jgi:hypothetical protein